MSSHPTTPNEAALDAHVMEHVGAPAGRRQRSRARPRLLNVAVRRIAHARRSLHSPTAVCVGRAQVTPSPASWRGILHIGARMPILHRTPRHVGIIPDGNRRWAEQHGLPTAAGYEAGVRPALRLLDLCRELRIEEVSAYGFTKENVRRPREQVSAFRDACVSFALSVVEAGAGLLVVGDANSPLFPDALRSFLKVRSAGTPRLNLLVNYGWQWDLRVGNTRARDNPDSNDPVRMIASRDVSRVDLVIRWGGRRRLSGFLPLQCAYADFAVVDTLWPDMRDDELIAALEWYQNQEVTLGG